MAVYAVLGSSASAAAAVPPCDPATRPALRFEGLPGRVVLGHEEVFGVEDAFATDAQVVGSVRVTMLSPGGKVFFRDSTRQRGAGIFFVALELGDRYARIHASFTEEKVDGERCQRTLKKTVKAVTRLYFPGRCFTPAYKPRTIVIACGDGNFYLTGLGWRRWNTAVARARGVAHANDCIPYCAAGHFHTYAVRVALSRRRLCRNVSRYVYTRLDYRYLGAGPPGSSPTGAVRFPCTLYEL
jgi:hypothetical protein